MPRSEVDLTGKRFTRLVVIHEEPRHKKPSGQMVRMWRCICDCGATRATRQDQLVNGTTKSCGCWRNDCHADALRTHGKSGCNEHPLYGKWEAMKSRCYQPNHASYRFYGGKGVEVDEPWKSSFQSFYDDMIDTWKLGLSLDRIDPRLNYNKSNCLWIPWAEQWNNLRKTVFAQYDGRIQSVIQWSREWGMPLRKAHAKLKHCRVPRPDASPVINL